MFNLRNKIHRALGVEESVEVGEVDGIRSLYLGSDTIQSSMRVKAPYDLHLAYSRGMMLFLLMAPHVRKILLMGLGGGSIPKYIHHYHPELSIKVVELNRQVIQIARSHFYLPEDDNRLSVVEGDGIQYVFDQPENTDLLMLDMFDGSGMALRLYTQDFFDACYTLLTHNGVLEINLWGSDKNFDIYIQRIEQSFQQRVLIIPTGRPGNVVVMAFKRVPNDLRWDSLREKARKLDQIYHLDFMDLLERLRDHNPNSTHRINME